MEKPETGVSDIPVLGWIIDFFAWAFAGLGVIFNMITFNIPEIPFTIRMIILIPYWGAILYIASPLISKIAEGMGNLIPFT